jgi:hypothetical protein
LAKQAEDPGQRRAGSRCERGNASR